MSDIIVLGAGMVGVTSALALQERGHKVILVDRLKPGQEASYGNAGIIQVEAMEPYAFPRAPLDIIRIALGLNNAVNYHLAALPSAGFPLLRYYLNSASGSHRAIANIYQQLISRSGADHDRLINAAGAESLIRRTGYIQMHRTARCLDADAAQAERFAKQYGVQSRILESLELKKEEPCLKRGFVGAVHWCDSRTCIDPGALVNAYAEMFRRQGGSLIEGEVQKLTQLASGWRLSFSERVDSAEAENVVVALGAWSPSFLRALGLSFPMVHKRGYHQHYQIDQPPSRPLFDVDAASLYCPMAKGLRLTTGAEIAHFSSPKTPRQLLRAERMAREVLDFGDAIEPEPWAGWRPCMPDMLPVVGPVTNRRGLWCNFGHGHQGFTLGPTSAQLLAELIDTEGEERGPRSLFPSRFLL